MTKKQDTAHKKGGSTEQEVKPFDTTVHAEPVEVSERTEDEQKKESKELETCKVELQVWKDKFLHVQADLENFTKRVSKERAHWELQAQVGLLKDLLPVIDNFDRATAEAAKEELSEDMKSWLDGFSMIHKGLHAFLKSSGIQEIDTSQGFDPELHEAITQIESADHESGAIVEVMEKGFMFKDHVLRPAKVVVAK